MIKNTKLESMITEAGNLIGLGEIEIKSALKAKKNIVFAGVLAMFALILIDNIASVGSRYAGGSINDFIQLGKFL